MTIIDRDLAPALADHLDDVIKAYDIRGVVPEQWNESTAYALGAAVADVLGGDRSHLLVGHDMRASCPALVSAFSAGAALRGVTVTSIGMCSTDGLYYASGALGLPGAMFTASHNPAQYNGIKLCRAGAQAVGQDTGLADIHRIAAEYLRSGHIPAAAESGELLTKQQLSDYAEYLRSLVDLTSARTLRVVVDAGNGMGGLTVPAVFGTTVGLPALPIELIPMYFELDGSFPNHEANPLEPKNLVDLQAAVVEHQADLGLAFDGDADRCFAVDERGEPISPSAVTALVALREIAKEPTPHEATILVNAITSSAVAEQVTAAGATVVRTKVGHSHIKAEMARTGAVFGGEHSAHYYFRDFWGADTGMLAALHLLAAVSEQDLPVSQMMAGFDPYVASGEINSTVADAAAATQRVVAALHTDDQTTLDTLDGTTIAAADRTWWCNVRPSNTEPLLRLNVEARDTATMARIRDAALAQIRSDDTADA